MKKTILASAIACITMSTSHAYWWGHGHKTNLVQECRSVGFYTDAEKVIYPGQWTVIKPQSNKSAVVTCASETSSARAGATCMIKYNLSAAEGVARYTITNSKTRATISDLGVELADFETAYSELRNQMDLGYCSSFGFANPVISSMDSRGHVTRTSQEEDSVNHGNNNHWGWGWNDDMSRQCVNYFRFTDSMETITLPITNKPVVLPKTNVAQAYRVSCGKPAAICDLDDKMIPGSIILFKSGEATFGSTRITTATAKSHNMIARFSFKQGVNSLKYKTEAIAKAREAKESLRDLGICQ
jgi:hypothetical protein